MAAFGTDTKKFTPLFNALLKSDGGFVNSFNNSPKLGANAQAGALTARITTAVTLQTPADGTMLTNNAARTEVDLTAFLGDHTASLFPYELAQWDADADAAEFAAFVDAARLAAEVVLITDLVGATPGHTETLTTTYIDFEVAAYTDAVAFDLLNSLDKCVGYIMANCGGKPNNMGIVTTPTGWSNLMSLMGISRLGRFLTMEGELLRYKTIPIWSSTVTVAGWAGAADAAAFVYHRDAEALVWSEVDIPHDDLRFYPDGLYKKFWQTYGFAGLIQGSHVALVDNPPS